MGNSDLSRGFLCPAGCGGLVFCRVASRAAAETPAKRAARCKRAATEDAGNAEHEGGPAAVLAGAACSRCARPVGADEAAAKLAEERWLRKTIRSWEAESPRGKLGKAKAMELERRIHATFGQHVAADRGYGHLAAVYEGLGHWRGAERLLDRRVSFERAAYPGPCGAHAWTLEAAGDMTLREHGVELRGLLRRPQRVSALQPLLNSEIAERVASRALPRYVQAAEVLRLLFGQEHEYYTEVAAKVAALRDALTAAAPGLSLDAVAVAPSAVVPDAGCC